MSMAPPPPLPRRRLIERLARSDRGLALLLLAVPVSMLAPSLVQALG